MRRTVTLQALTYEDVVAHETDYETLPFRWRLTGQRKHIRKVRIIDDDDICTVHHEHSIMDPSYIMVVEGEPDCMESQ